MFFGDPTVAVECALEIARQIKSQPNLKLRMGLHTGPVYRVADINTNLNVAGGGINFAQRIMDGEMPVTSWFPPVWQKSCPSSVAGKKA